MKERTGEEIRRLVDDALTAKGLDCKADLTVGPLADRPGRIWRVSIKCKGRGDFKIEVSERGSDDEIRQSIAANLIND